MTPSKRLGAPEALNESLFSFLRRKPLKTSTLESPLLPTLLPPLSPPVSPGVSQSTDPMSEGTRKKLQDGRELLRQIKDLLEQSKSVLGNSGEFEERLKELSHSAPPPGKLSKKRLSPDIFLESCRTLLADVQKALEAPKIEPPKLPVIHWDATVDQPRRRSPSPKHEPSRKSSRRDKVPKEVRQEGDLARRESQKPSMSTSTKHRDHRDTDLNKVPTQSRSQRYYRVDNTTDGSRRIDSVRSRYRDEPKRSDSSRSHPVRKRSYDRLDYYKDRDHRDRTYNKDYDYYKDKDEKYSSTDYPRESKEKEYDRARSPRHHSDMSDYYSKDTSDSRARRHERRRTSPERSRVDLSREQPRDQTRDQSRRHSPAERKPRTPSPEHTRRNPYVVHEDFSLTAVSPIPRMSFAPTVVAYPVSDDEGDSRPNRDDRRRRARTRSPGYTTSPRRHQSQRHEYRPRDRIEGESTDRRERRDRPPISRPPPASTPSKVGSQPSVEDRSRFAEMFSPIKNGEQPLPTIRPLVL